MTTAVAVQENQEIATYRVTRNEARMFAISPLVPQHLRAGGIEVAEANCFIALHLAKAMNENPMVVLQNIHIVNGKAGFSSQYMIARANASGVFKGRINWRIDRSNPQNLSVTAYAVLADTGEVVEAPVDMNMATAEGWTKNAKYKTMPEVMLRYRSAAFLVRWYCPDVMLGYQTAEEVEDVAVAALPSAPTITAADIIAQAQSKPETIDLKPEPQGRNRAQAMAFTLTQGLISQAQTIEALEDAWQTAQAGTWSQDELNALHATYEDMKAALGQRIEPQSTEQAPAADLPVMDYEEALASLGMAEIMVDLEKAWNAAKGCRWSDDEYAGLEQAYTDRRNQLRKGR